LGSYDSQSTIDSAVIDLGPSMFEDEMVYVAISWVRTLEGVVLLDLVTVKIKASKLIYQEMVQLRFIYQSTID